jgi:hypothetical protein
LAEIRNLSEELKNKEISKRSEYLNIELEKIN